MRIVLITLCLSGLVYLWLHSPWSPYANSNLMRFYTLDVGQGDALYIGLPHNLDIVVDTGPDDRILSQLSHYLPLGDNEIELLVLTHNHLDHIGGFQSIASHYKIDRVWLSGALDLTAQFHQLVDTIKSKNIPADIVKAGDNTQLGPVQLIVLHPVVSQVNRLPKDQHDATVALKVTYKQICMILTGDLNTDHETNLLSAAKQLKLSIRCPILKTTHHGSGSGSSSAFLQIVQPKVATISVGKHNLYHHPAPSTMERLIANGVQIFRTDQQGTVTVTTDGQNYWTKTEK